MDDFAFFHFGRFLLAALVVLAVSRFARLGRPWFTVAVIASLLTLLTLLVISVSFRDHTDFDKVLLQWPIPFPHVWPNLLFWFLVWMILVHFWIPRPHGGALNSSRRGSKIAREAELQTAIAEVREQLARTKSMIAELLAAGSRDGSDRPG